MSLSQVRKLEAQGIPSKHAEAITSTITEVLNDSLENLSQSLVSKGELQKVSFIGYVLLLRGFRKFINCRPYMIGIGSVLHARTFVTLSSKFMNYHVPC